MSRPGHLPVNNLSYPYRNCFPVPGPATLQPHPPLRRRGATTPLVLDGCAEGGAAAGAGRRVRLLLLLLLATRGWASCLLARCCRLALRADLHADAGGCSLLPPRPRFLLLRSRRLLGCTGRRCRNHVRRRKGGALALRRLSASGCLWCCAC